MTHVQANIADCADVEKLPSDFPEMLTLARALNERFCETQSVCDFFGAVLAANHIVDWHFEMDRRERFVPTARQARLVLERFPAWQCIRDLSNGAKHAVRARSGTSAARLLNLETVNVEWEHRDAWPFLGRHVQIWFVEWHGELRYVHGLCDQFLTEFAAWTEEYRRDQAVVCRSD
jgi:hypothetical protein